MNRLDEPETLNVDALIEILYALQTSLKILIDQIASSRNPDIYVGTVNVLVSLNAYLLTQQPSLRRH